MSLRLDRSRFCGHSVPQRMNARMAVGAVDRAVILETVRTGTSGIGRGERILRV